VARRAVEFLKGEVAGAEHRESEEVAHAGR
jgi:hypothetical protein